MSVRSKELTMKIMQAGALAVTLALALASCAPSTSKPSINHAHHSVSGCTLHGHDILHIKGHKPKIARIKCG